MPEWIPYLLALAAYGFVGLRLVLWLAEVTEPKEGR